ncbi:MAG: hypothetical protein ACRDC6_20065 [Shewanella sp.]|uniref:hypothetical protein n=1 Tax=Aeromonas veronii TaxID=654 RepID=UPI003D2096E2
MEWQSIISSGIQHLAWPITILVIIFALKNKIPDVSKLKINDVEVEFEKTVNAIRNDAKATSSGSWKITSTSSLLPNMLQLAEKSPLGLILQSWDILEQTVLQCASENGFKDAYNAAVAIQYLDEKKLVKEDKLNLFFRLYALNKRFSNFENEQLPKERAIETADMTLKIAEEIRQEAKHNQALAVNVQKAARS